VEKYGRAGQAIGDNMAHAHAHYEVYSESKYRFAIKKIE